MGWTGGQLQGPFTARAAIEFDLGADFAARVIDTVRYGTVIYAAVRSREGDEVFGLVLLAERRGGILYTKPISEDMGPAEDRCPARILDLLTDRATIGRANGVSAAAPAWPSRVRARVRQSPSPRPLTFTNGETHSTFTYQRRLALSRRQRLRLSHSPLAGA